MHYKIYIGRNKFHGHVFHLHHGYRLLGNLINRISQFRKHLYAVVIYVFTFHGISRLQTWWVKNPLTFFGSKNSETTNRYRITCLVGKCWSITATIIYFFSSPRHISDLFFHWILKTASVRSSDRRSMQVQLFIMALSHIVRRLHTHCTDWLTDRFAQGQAPQTVYMHTRCMQASNIRVGHTLILHPVCTSSNRFVIRCGNRRST